MERECHVIGDWHLSKFLVSPVYVFEDSQPRDQRSVVKDRRYSRLTPIQILSRNGKSHDDASVGFIDF